MTNRHTIFVDDDHVRVHHLREQDPSRRQVQHSLFRYVVLINAGWNKSLFTVVLRLSTFYKPVQQSFATNETHPPVLYKGPWDNRPSDCQASYLDSRSGVFFVNLSDCSPVWPSANACLLISFMMCTVESIHYCGIECANIKFGFPL